MTPWSATASMVFSGIVLTVFGATSSVTYRVSEYAGFLTPVDAHSGRWTRAPSALSGCVTLAADKDLLVGRIGEAGVGHTGLAAQRERLVGADLLQPLSISVSTRDTKNDATEWIFDTSWPACLGRFDPGQVCVHHLAVPLDREDQRDVDRDAFGECRSDGRQPRLGGGDLDQQVGPVDDLPQLDGLRTVLSVSCASRGSTSMDTRPSTPSEASHCGRSTSHPSRTSSVVTVRIVASTSAPRSASSATCSS